jgi:hypothetical protein
MPFRLGVLAYPLFITVIYAARPNAVAAFEKADAYSPETSRRPASIAVPQKTVTKAVRKGLLVATGDGRYYVDRDAVKRRDRRLLAMAAIGGLVLTGLVVLLV